MIVYKIVPGDNGINTGDKFGFKKQISKTIYDRARAIDPYASVLEIAGEVHCFTHADIAEVLGGLSIKEYTRQGKLPKNPLKRGNALEKVQLYIIKPRKLNKVKGKLYRHTIQDEQTTISARNGIIYCNTAMNLDNMLLDSSQVKDFTTDLNGFRFSLGRKKKLNLKLVQNPFWKNLEYGDELLQEIA